VPLAIYFRSYWALVAGIVSGQVLGVIISYWIHPFRPRFSFVAAKEMYNFSKWLLLNNFANFLRNRSPDFIIGRLSGASALGLFTIAYEISTLPTSELVAPINRVALPGYSKLAKDPDALRESYLDMLALIAFVSIPAGAGISLVAAPLVELILGDKWLAAIPLVSVLALFASVNAIQTNAGSLFNALGKPYLISICSLINIAILLALSIPAAYRMGPQGVAFAYLIAFTIQAPITFAFVARAIQVPLSKFISVFWRPLLAATTMYILGLEIASGVDTTFEFGPLGKLVLLITTGIFTYSFASIFLWWINGRQESIEYRTAIYLFNSIRRRTA
jgi:O-antigen/teichoic acid export membrane protein